MKNKTLEYWKKRDEVRGKLGKQTFFNHKQNISPEVILDPERGYVTTLSDLRERDGRYRDQLEAND